MHDLTNRHNVEESSTNSLGSTDYIRGAWPAHCVSTQARVDDAWYGTFRRGLLPSRFNSVYSLSTADNEDIKNTEVLRPARAPPFTQLACEVEARPKRSPTIALLTAHLSEPLRGISRLLVHLAAALAASESRRQHSFVPSPRQRLQEQLDSYSAQETGSSL